MNTTNNATVLTKTVLEFSECNCSSAGAINGTVCTNDTIGQCQCKTGVTGRSCDQCTKYFTNFSDTGCAGNLNPRAKTSSLVAFTA